MSPATALIVTLQMEAGAAARFTALRRAHFPAERNFLDAHVTLFHALPVAALDTVLTDVAEQARATAPFTLRVDRLLFLGRGVAYGLTSADGTRLRQALADRWRPLLGPQDSAWHGRLHVTVQNKVPPAAARALQAELARDFQPEEVGAAGLAVWYYVGGPWRPAATFGFDGSAPSARAAPTDTAAR